MKAKVIIFCLMAIINLPLFAQSFCGTPDTDLNALANISSSFLNAPGPYTIRVFAHILRQSTCTGGMTAAELNTALTVLQNDLSPHNICISLVGKDEICNTTLYNSNMFGNFNTIVNTNVTANAIDIYFMPTSSPSPGGRASGIPGRALVVGGTWSDGTIVYTSHILSHELGHCLGLFHTHHGANEGNCNEYVNGTNCTTCGDFVCDTPADPGLQFNVNASTCNWNSSGNDPLGQPYNPDERIIMSYTTPTCMTYFTSGEGVRMRDHIANTAVLQARTVPANVLVQNRTFTTGDILCEGRLSVSAGKNVNPQTTVGNVVTNNAARTIFRAGGFVLMNDGFLAEPSTGRFEAYIDPNSCSEINSVNSAKTSENNNGIVTNTTSNLLVAPNPFTHSTTIHYQLTEASQQTSLIVYDLMGREVKHLLPATAQEAGDYEYQLEADGLLPGIYLCVLKTDNEVKTHKIMLTR